PLDPVPRIIPADQWDRITAGVEQRARALELFLRDVYGPGEIVRAGVVPQEALDRAPGYRRYGRAVPDGALHAPVSGADLVSTGPGEWLVLEDNLRMPGGLAMAVTVRDRIREGYPAFHARRGPRAGRGSGRAARRPARRRPGRGRGPVDRRRRRGGRAQRARSPARRGGRRCAPDHAGPAAGGRGRGVADRRGRAPPRRRPL